MTTSASPFDNIADFLFEDRQHIDGLAPADHRLVEIGCLLTLDCDSPELRSIYRQMLRAGPAAALLESILIHATGYLGVVRMRRAHHKFLAELSGAKTTLSWPEEHAINPDRAQRVRSGSRLYDRFEPGRQAVQAAKFEALSPIYYPRAMELTGLVLAPSALPPRERQIVTVAILSCLGGQTEQLRFHIGVARRCGVSRETLAGILILVQAYAGMPRANSAASLALEVLDGDPE